MPPPPFPFAVIANRSGYLGRQWRRWSNLFPVAAAAAEIVHWERRTLKKILLRTLRFSGGETKLLMKSLWGLSKCVFLFCDEWPRPSGASPFWCLCAAQFPNEQFKSPRARGRLARRQFPLSLYVADRYQSVMTPPPHRPKSRRTFAVLLSRALSPSRFRPLYEGKRTFQSFVLTQRLNRRRHYSFLFSAAKAKPFNL